MSYIAGFVLSFGLAVVLVPLVIRLAQRIGAIDQPQPGTRKIHTRAMPRAGGLVLYTSFVVTSLLLVPHAVMTTAFWGLIAALSIVLVVGLLDDIYDLNPWIKLAVQTLAAMVAVSAGIKITVISNFSGGFSQLYAPGSHLAVGGLNIATSLLATALSLIWLVGMTNTINFLDGLDGLAAGVAGIAAVVMFALSISARVNQPTTALLAIILAGSCFGYLCYNFYPARIFNGDSGAYFLGLTLAILSIISGAKLATALLVLGLPILDALWAVLRRIFTGRSPFSADRGHIHFLLLDAGLTQRQTVLIIYGFSIAFGTVALLSGTTQKLVALAVLVSIMAVMLTILQVRYGARMFRRTRAARAKSD